MRTITVLWAACAVMFVNSETPAGLTGLDGNAEAWDFAKGVGYYDSTTGFTALEIYAGVDTNGGFDDTYVRGTVSNSGQNVTVVMQTLDAGNGAWSLEILFELTGAPGTEWLIQESGLFTDIMDFVPDTNAANPGQITGDLATTGAYRLVVNNPDWQNLFNGNGQISFDETWADGTGTYTLQLLVPAPAAIAALPLVLVGCRRRRRSH
jgi:hypothetical protein